MPVKQDLQPTVILLSPHNQGLLEQELSRQNSDSLTGELADHDSPRFL